MYLQVNALALETEELGRTSLNVKNGQKLFSILDDTKTEFSPEKLWQKFNFTNEQLIMFFFFAKPLFCCQKVSAQVELFNKPLLN